MSIFGHLKINLAISISNSHKLVFLVLFSNSNFRGICLFLLIFKRNEGSANSFFGNIKKKISLILIVCSVVLDISKFNWPNLENQEENELFKRSYTIGQPKMYYIVSGHPVTPYFLSCFQQFLCYRTTCSWQGGWFRPRAHCCRRRIRPSRTIDHFQT